MMYNINPKGFFNALEVTENNLDLVATAIGGDVKGTKLPTSQRVIRWYDRFREEEREVKVGEYVVMFFNSQHHLVEAQAYTKEILDQLFTVNGPVK